MYLQSPSCVPVMSAVTPSPSPEPTKPRRGVDAVEVVTTLLGAILAHDHPPRLKDIETTTGIPSAKLHRYLVSLVDGGLVKRVDGNRYDFGLLAYQIAQRAAHKGDMLSLVEPFIQEYANDIGHTCGIGLLFQNAITMVRWYQPEGAFSISLRPGLQVPATASSTGMVFAAHLSRPQSEPLVRAELEKIGELDDERLEAVYQRYAQIVADGIAHGSGLRIPGLNSLSVPVFDRTGTVAMVITAVGYEPSFPAGPDCSHATPLKALGLRLSRMMGHSYVP